VVPPNTVRFGPHDISYDDRVLEPRPWTLLQSEWAAELSEHAPPGPMLELCAGAGQIGLAAAWSSGRSLVQVDADPVACDFARANAAALGLGDRVEVRCGDLSSTVPLAESFPIILADPPYLPTTLVPRFPGDPVRAIDGGNDGLRVTRSCVLVIAAHLARGGAALVQVHGSRQARKLERELPVGMCVDEVRSHDAERAVALLRRAEPVTPNGADPR
jgi:methylase of polypeptide subunit release factors